MGSFFPFYFPMAFSPGLAAELEARESAKPERKWGEEKAATGSKVQLTDEAAAALFSSSQAAPHLTLTCSSTPSFIVLHCIALCRYCISLQIEGLR